METASQFLLTPSKLEGDDIAIFSDAVTVADLKKPIEDLADGRTKQLNKIVNIPSSSAAKKGYPHIPTCPSNILTFNPYDLLSQEFDPGNYKKSGDDPESEEEVEVVFYESVNLLNSTKTGATYMAPDASKT
ncbi:hypothetical protein Tco_1192013 [Tanacetum coccineum]